MSLQGLPNEILSRILLLSDVPDLLSLCHTSWTINNAATDVLYRSYSNDTLKADSSALFLRTICRSSDLAAKIRELTFGSFEHAWRVDCQLKSVKAGEEGDASDKDQIDHNRFQLFVAAAIRTGLIPQRHWISSTMPPADDCEFVETLVYALSVGSEDAHNLIIVALSPNLRILNLGWAPSSYPRPLGWGQFLSGSMTALKNLTRVKIRRKLRKAVPDRLTSTFLTTVPCLEDLSYSYNDFESHNLPLATKVLTRLSLQRCIFDVPWLHEFLYGQPLASFDYRQNLVSGPPAHLVLGALVQCSSTLRTLKVRSHPTANMAGELNEAMQEFHELKHFILRLVDLTRSSAENPDIDSLLRIRIPRHIQTLSLWLDRKPGGLDHLARLCMNGAFPYLTEVRNLVHGKSYNGEEFASYRTAFAEAGVSLIDLASHREGTHFAGLRAKYVVASGMSKTEMLRAFSLPGLPATETQNTLEMLQGFRNQQQ